MLTPSARLQLLRTPLSGTSVWRPQSRYTVSRIECRIKFPQNQRCRAKIALHPLKSRCRTFLRTPLSHFPLVRSRQGARRAGGGYRGTFGFRKRIALQGGIAATVTPVALLCATKNPRNTRRMPPCAVKTCAVRPVFARVVGELRAADPKQCPRARKAKCQPRGTI